MWYRLFCMVSAVLVMVCCSSVAFAVEDGTASADSSADASISSADVSADVEADVEADVVEDSPVVVEPLYDSENPLPVVIVEEEEPGYEVSTFSGDAPVLVIGNTPPDELLFNGAGWVTGYDSSLGTVTLYLPINYQEGYLGTDSNGYLYNISSSSLSGYLSGVYNNSVTFSGFSYPRYRLSSGSSYVYYDLRLVPTDSNMQIAVSDAPRYSMSDFTPYLLVLLGGVLVVCFMRRS